MTRKGFPIIVSAASGTGKTTLVDQLMKHDSDIAVAISYTTRKPRGTEVNGKDYYFIDVATFRKMISNGDFIEWAEVHGNFYGTAKSTTDKMLEGGTDIVFIVDVQGGQNIKKVYPDTLMTFLYLPSMDLLEERLRNRKTDKEEDIAHRLLAAYQEIKVGVDVYEYLIDNTILEKALFDIKSIIHAQRVKLSDRSELLTKIHKSI